MLLETSIDSSVEFMYLRTPVLQMIDYTVFTRTYVSTSCFVKVKYTSVRENMCICLGQNVVGEK